ncbi:MAG: Usg family protein [Rhodospirillaceae bacterium]|nr:Usg family protein [Rhodospirillaceae bacterium]
MTKTSELGRMLNDYRLATAEILYRLPDHPSLLQSYVWQDYDIAPRFPTLQKFLGFWESNIEGRLHSVRICSARLLKPHEVRHAQATFTLH